MCFGIMLCILWIFFVKTTPVSDFNYYNQLATDISKGGFWGDTRQAIGYPIVLGLIYKIFGSSVWVAKCFNIFLTLCNYYLFFIILCKINLKENLKKITFAIFVFFPNIIFYNSILAKEILFTTIILLVTNIYFSKFKYKNIIIGILIGFGTIIHASFIAIIFGIFLVNIISKRETKKSLIGVSIVLFFTLLTISPLIYRNSKLMGRLTYVSTNSGVVLYINNNSQNKSGMWMSANDVENSVVNTNDFKNGNRAVRCQIFKSAAKAWILSHPKRFVELGLIRLNNTYFASEDTFWTFPGSGFSEKLKEQFMTNVKNIRCFVFFPAIIYVIGLSVEVLRGLIKRKKFEQQYSFKLYCLMLFYMFSCTQFITEGQSRYFFPLIFVMVFFFVQFFQTLYLYIKQFKGVVRK